MRARAGIRRALWAALGFALTVQTGCQTSVVDESPPADSTMKDRVTPGVPTSLILISMTGLSPDLYRPGRTTPTPTPVVAKLAAQGVSVDVLTPVIPASVYPVHASLITGRRPDRHGVPADHLLGDHGVRPARPWSAARLEGTPLWLGASQARRRTAALDWPTTLGAGITELVPDLEAVREGETWLGLLETAASPSLLGRIHSAAADAPVGRPWPSTVERDELMLDLACDIAAMPEVPALWLIRLRAPGEAIETHGPASTQASKALSRADAGIARLMRCLEKVERLDSTGIVIVGDRAMTAVHTRISVNAALASAGLLELDARGTIESWDAVVRSNGGSAWVYARDEEAAVAARQALLATAFTTGTYRIVPAAEMQDLHADPQAWFGLEAEPGFVFIDAPRLPVLQVAGERATSGYLSNGLRRTDEGRADGHRLEAFKEVIGMVAWGRGFRKGLRVPALRQIDLAPTLALLLGIRLEEVDGRPVVGLLDGSAVESRL